MLRYSGMVTMRSLIATACCCFSVTSALIPNVPELTQRTSQQIASRRAFVSASILGISLAPSVTSTPSSATAATSDASIPMLTTDEFMLVLRDSSRSIAQVEIFNGARVVVRLLDGTAFGINDVVESSTDPRSVLKIAALCREYKVPCKFVDIQAALLNTSTTKRKNYANSRVQEANVREKERLERMQKDEDERLLELQQMQKNY
ncbi:hypothetical protein MPSEU_000995900 [Mayamaea pseudoterrestris]|nr:hypothetical protein MPSEU_000995900 [Mayamaea pseudoterrestris]